MSVSVIVPAYNRAQRLPRALASALSQGVSDLEVIVIDDGSTDDTRAVVAGYGSLVRYHHQANAGPGAARNAGIGLATRPLLAFLDSDDEWRPGKLAMQLALLERFPEVGLVFSDFVIERADGSCLARGADTWAGRPLDFPGMERVRLVPDPARGPNPFESVDAWVGAMYGQLLTEFPVLTSSIVVRRSALDDRARFAERVVLFEDWEFVARVARLAAVGYIDFATTVNVGHVDPGRVSKCSPLDRARSYRGLLERVWLADERFMRDEPARATSAYGAALLAVVREALLSGDREAAREAQARWRALRPGNQRAWAVLYDLCRRIPAGPAVLRSVLRGRSLWRRLSSPSRSVHGAVNPAA